MTKLFKINKLFLEKSTVAFLVFVLIFSIFIGDSWALTPAQQQVYSSGINYFDVSSCSDASSSTASSGSTFTPNNSAAQTIAQNASTGGAQVGYALYDSSGDQLANFNDTFENYGASITKSMILVAYLNQEGSSAISQSVQSTLTGMIEDSINGDANTILGLLNNPSSEINNVASQAGMTGFKYNDTGDSEYYLGQSQITANDFAKFFSKIDTMFPAAQKSFALNLLSHLAPSDQVGLLQAGLPGTVYSKEGWKSEPGGPPTDPSRSGSPNPFGDEGAPYIVNQAGQFTINGSTYGVAVTVGGTTNRSSGEEIVKNIVSALVSPGGTPASSSGNSCACSSGSTGPVTLTGSDNGQKIWNFLSSNAGLSPNQTAGVMGNLYAQDSTFNPEQVQIPPGGNSTTPTTQHDVGWGIAQWTPTSGPNPIIADAKTAGVPANEMDTLAGQLTILLSELNNTSPAGKTDMIKTLMQQSSISDAASEFFTDYEGGGSGGAPQAASYGMQMMQQYGGSGSSGGDSSSGCQSVSCNTGSQTSSLSPLRQNIVCLAQQQAALWGSKPLSYRNQGYYDYSNNVMELWCADFVSWVYKNAGDPFPNGTRDGWDISFVGNIPSVTTKVSGFTYHSVSGAPYTPKPGDIGIFSTYEPYGHAALFISSSGGTTTWIGGDQGPTPNGEYGDSPNSESTVDASNYEPTLMGYVSPDGN